MRADVLQDGLSAYGPALQPDCRVMRVTLDPKNPSKVTSFQPFLSGGVPGDKGAVTGPNPPVPVGATYNGEQHAWPRCPAT